VDCRLLLFQRYSTKHVDCRKISTYLNKCLNSFWP
jgi:hypothetical protein